MEILFVQLKLKWQSHLKIEDMRRFIITKLEAYGEPIRWSISSIDSQRNLNVEAMVLTYSSEEKK